LRAGNKVGGVAVRGVKDIKPPPIATGEATR
jgi:hypothetical protein